MTFDASEKSQYRGAPVECYRFSYGETLYLWTSADEEVVLPQGTFTPTIIAHSALEHDKESGSGGTEITVPRDSPVVAEFVTYLPITPVSAIIYRGHRGDLANAIPIFFGTVSSFTSEGSEATLTCAPFNEALQRMVPLLCYQTQCNYALYGAGCDLSSLAFRDAIVVGSVSGSGVLSAAFTRAANWYRNGWLEDANGDVRFIVASAVGSVTLMNPFPGLLGGDTVYAYSGCDRTEATCNSKFSNLVNHLGFPRIPTKSPFMSSLS